MIDWQKVFTKDFFFSIDRLQLHRVDWVVLYFGGALVLIWLVLWIVRRRLKNPISQQLVARVGKLMLTIGLLEALWFGLRYQNVVWFGTHVVAAGLGVIGLVWLIFIIKYYFTLYRIQRQSWEKEQTKLKY